MVLAFDLRIYVWVGLLGLLLGLGLGAAGMHHYDSLKHDKVVSDLNKKHADELRAISDAAALQAREAAKTLSEKTRAAADVDAKHTKELNDAKSEINRLRTAVDAGALKLRIAAKAAARSSDVPATAGTSRVDDGAIELDAAARQAYFDLRMSIAEDQQKIAALQQYVTDVCRPAVGQ